jgi:Tol biopolymer transport system component
VNTPPETKPANTVKLPERIVFVSDEETSPLRQMYVMRIDGSERTRITHDLNDYIDPAFSPDGLRILATSHTQDCSDQIYVMNADGGNLVNLSNAPGDNRFASFNPDGSKVVFTSTREGNGEIYVMDSEGKHQTRLTSNAITDHSPQFSPDGSKIIYCSSAPDESGRYTSDSYVMSYDIYIMNSDGSGKRCLTEDLGYFARAPELGRDIFSVHELQPGVSSDGSQIILTSYIPNSIYDNKLFIMDSSGESQRHVVSGDVAAPVFAPGDKKIILRSHRDGKFDLYEIDLDGTHLQKLTNDTPGHTVFSQFSPDGSKILFFTDVLSREKIWIMNRDGTGQTQLTHGAGNDSYPRFQPIRQ